MNEIFLHKNALEVLVEIAINHQKLNSHRSCIESICRYYDNFYKTTEFSEDLEGIIEKYKSVLMNDDEHLFILDSHIPLLIKEQKIILKDEKLKIYLIILEWIKEFTLPDYAIYLKLVQYLDLEPAVASQAQSFILSDPPGKQSPKLITIKPLSDEHLEELEGDWVDTNKPDELQSQESFYIPNISNEFYALFLEETNSFLVTCNNKKNTYRKNNELNPGKFCLLQLGDKINLEKHVSLGYTELKTKLVEKLHGQKFILASDHAGYLYRNRRGIKPFNLVAYPGQLIGVIGKEGAGKSTVLKLLAGIQKPAIGNIFINAYNLSRFRYQLSGLIGYVPDEDSLFSELTAYENLEFIAKLHLSKKSSSERSKIITKILKELELSDIKNTRVGKTEEKNIQPKQRRLLNIALELVRDPDILIIDNAKTGLSLNDASSIIELLVKYTFEGKLIITTITQTSENVYENFDKLLIISDDGYPLYYGPRNSCFGHFLSFLPHGYKGRYQSGKQNLSDDILELLDLKHPSLTGVQPETIIPEKKLYEENRQKTTKELQKAKEQKRLPGIKNQIPRLEIQFLAYFSRNFKVKLARKTELVYTLVAAPILAVILALILKYSPGENYAFSLNENISVYFYIGIIITIFLGLSQSAGEVITQKHILRKEEQLNLSIFSYYNSKISYLLIILFIQTFLFTLIGNYILEIKGMLVYHWLVYFSCGSAGVFLGLIFSSTHKSYDSILLRSIPVTLIVIILLGGGWISLDKINANKNKYTPLISDFMISRWAYEAIMVQQFSSNPYEKIFFDVDKAISIGSFNTYQMLPLLGEYIEFVNENYEQKPDTCSLLLSATAKRFEYFNTTEDIFPFEFNDVLLEGEFSERIYAESQEYLNYLKYYYTNKYKNGITQKGWKVDSIEALHGKAYLEKLEKENKNLQIAQKVRKTNQRRIYKIVDDELVQLSEIVFQPASNEYGRAQLFSSEKKFGDQIINTFEFNLSIIWFLNLIVYLILITNFPARVADFFDETFNTGLKY
jgi:ABC-type multidrug transport system ATPase subunit